MVIVSPVGGDEEKKGEDSIDVTSAYMNYRSVAGG